MQGDGLLEVPGIPVGGGEVASAGQGVGVVRSEDAFGVGEVLLVQGDGLVEVPGIPVGVGEVVAAVQGVGVVGSEDLFAEAGVGGQINSQTRQARLDTPPHRVDRRGEYFRV